MSRNGLDLLGIAKFKQVAVRNFPQGWALGAFSQTFGDSLPAIEAVIRTGKCPQVRVHLLWSDTHTFTTQDIPRAVKEAKRVSKLIAKYPNIVWQVSGCCEHKMSQSLAEQFRVKVLAACPPSTEYVNAPMQGGAMLTNCRNEVHGSHAHKPKGKYQFSFDGQSASDADVVSIRENLSDAETFFYWNSRFNGKSKDDDTTPRPQRTAWPDSNYMKAIIYLATDKGNCSLPKDALWKPISEKNFPCLITPKKSATVELKQNGLVVHKMKYFGQYVDGRNRYYASEWGYKLGVCDVFINKIKLGTVNCGFRQNSYR